MKRCAFLLVICLLLLPLTQNRDNAAQGAPVVTPSAPAAPANTAQVALQTLTDFLPAESAPAAVPSPTLGSSQPLWDLLPAYAGIHQAYQDALVGLTSGEVLRYTDVLTSDYQQTEPSGQTIDKAEVEKRLWNVVQRNRCTEARYGIASLQMTTPRHATATAQEHWECFSLNTPPTEFRAKNGKTFTINNTTHTTVTLLLQQEWVQQGETWRIEHVRALQVSMTSVL